MASLAATNWPKPLVLVPCLSWSTASGVFTEGVISGAINWEMLESQFRSDEIYKATLQKMVSIIEDVRKLSDDAFRAGQEFAKTFDQSIATMENNPREGKSSSDLDAKDKYKDTFMQQLDSVNDSSSKTQVNVGGLFKFRVPNISKLRMTNKEDRDAVLQTLNESKTTSKSTDKKMNWREHEALHFMRGIMDECTHLKNFSQPVDTSLIVNVCASDDGYVPREGFTDLTDIWPGAEVRYLDAGHVSAYVLHQKVFRSAIIDAFNRARNKYKFNT